MHAYTHTHTRTHAQRQSWLQLSWVGVTSLLKSANGISYSYNLHTSILHIQQAHFINTSGKPCSVLPHQCCSAPQHSMWSSIPPKQPYLILNFLYFTAQPPLAWRLMTTLLNNGLFVWTNTPIWSLSSPAPNHTVIIFTATMYFWIEVGWGRRKMEPGTFCQPRHPNHQSGNLWFKIIVRFRMWCTICQSTEKI